MNVSGCVWLIWGGHEHGLEKGKWGGAVTVQMAPVLATGHATPSAPQGWHFTHARLSLPSPHFLLPMGSQTVHS